MSRSAPEAALAVPVNRAYLSRGSAAAPNPSDPGNRASSRKTMLLTLALSGLGWLLAWGLASLLMI